MYFEKIKKLPVILIVFSALFFYSKPGFCQYNSGNFFVHLKGTIKIVHAYKGGAAPPEELLEKLSIPECMNNAQLYLKKTYYGKTFFTLTTDSSGNFDLQIKPGVYNIYLSNENSSSKTIIDTNETRSYCEEQFKTQSYGTLKVYRKGNSPVEITINEKINPCGPMPQSASPKQN